jgi:REP-associated tyrosine transposase
MGRLKHRTAPGHTYFVTTDGWQKRAVFQVPEVAEILCERIIACRDSGAYLLHEFVVMPDHLHLLITPGMNKSLERALQLIKGGSSHEIHQRRGHKMQLWQPGFQEWTVRDAADFAAKARYIRLNPVTAVLVERAEQWAYSSASGRFALDPAPELFTISGAEAHRRRAGDVGPKGPTP